MAHMILTACLFSKQTISFNLCPLAFRANTLVIMKPCILTIVDITALKQVIHLTMGRNYFAELCTFRHCLLHKCVSLHTRSVITEADRNLCHRFKINNLSDTLATLCDCTERQHINNSISFDDVSLHLQIFCTVRCRIQIRHCAKHIIACSCTGC